MYCGCDDDDDDDDEIDEDDDGDECVGFDFVASPTSHLSPAHQLI